MNPLLRKLNRVHLVGIGGVGMEGLARYLGSVGISVQGSDFLDSQTLKLLSEDGFKTWSFHDPSHVEQMDLVIYSAAVRKENPELIAAKKLGIGLISRAEFVGEISRWHETISVAGTHGKTTTASMLSKIFLKSGRSPSLLVGGTYCGRALAKFGRDPWLILEADEYAKSFLYFNSDWAIITGVEAEHLDFYGTFSELKMAFVKFANNLPFYGEIFIAGDGLVNAEIIEEIQTKITTFGFGNKCSYRIVNFNAINSGSSFDFYFKNKLLGHIELNIPGEYNARNAAGAAAVAFRSGISWEIIADSLKSYKAADRRFEQTSLKDNILMVDDYAHHPSEIASVLNAARNTRRRVIVVFQPHLYSRTKDFFYDFSKELMNADYVIITEIYSARENFVPNLSGAMIVDQMLLNGFPEVCFIKNLFDVVPHIKNIVRPGDMVVAMGAGDVWKVAKELIDTIGEAP